MRMFVAVTPPAELIEHLAEFLEPRQEVDSPLRWSSPEQWHVTLAFLPSVADADLDDLSDELTEMATRRSSFALQVMGAGAFPNPAEAKTLWAGVAGELEPLGRLATATRSAAVQAGLEVDGGRFRPHLTLARIGRAHDVTRWLRILELYDGPSWQVEEFALIQSHLGGGRKGHPRYEVRELFTLSGK
jgi:RNA 2',3'-cyclic 3'-phosphodiesterase